MSMRLLCPKCKHSSGNTWGQCEGACPVEASPHYKPDLYWYRFDDRTYSVCHDPDMEIYGTSTEVQMTPYRVISTTRTGAWLEQGFGHTRFAKRDCRKRFACPTIEEAKASYIARKKRQASIYKARMEHAEWCIRKVEGKELW